MYTYHPAYFNVDLDIPQGVQHALLRDIVTPTGSTAASTAGGDGKEEEMMRKKRGVIIDGDGDGSLCSECTGALPSMTRIHMTTSYTTAINPTDKTRTVRSYTRECSGSQVCLHALAYTVPNMLPSSLLGKDGDAAEGVSGRGGGAVQFRTEHPSWASL